MDGKNNTIFAGDLHQKLVCVHSMPESQCSINRMWWHMLIKCKGGWRGRVRTWRPSFTTYQVLCQQTKKRHIKTSIQFWSKWQLHSHLFNSVDSLHNTERHLLPCSLIARAHYMTSLCHDYKPRRDKRIICFSPSVSLITHDAQGSEQIAH